MKILVINGANLNLLGTREPEIYGSSTYEDLVDELKTFALSKNVEIKIFQSNIEGEIVSEIQKAKNIFDGIVINAGGYSHSSVVIYDVLKAIDIPTIEVHISNVLKREEFRQNAIIARACIGQISGLGVDGYKFAISFLIEGNNKKISPNDLNL